MNIFKFLDGEQNKGNNILTYEGDIISSEKLESIIKESYIKDFEENREITFTQYKQQWIRLNTIEIKKVMEVIIGLIEESLNWHDNFILYPDTNIL